MENLRRSPNLNTQTPTRKLYRGFIRTNFCALSKPLLREGQAVVGSAAAFDAV
jgi:hypothetical protein